MVLGISLPGFLEDLLRYTVNLSFLYYNHYYIFCMCNLINSSSSSLFGESTSFLLSSQIIASLATTDRAKLNCRRRYIGFESNRCLAFVNFANILRNIDDSKRSEISRNGYILTEIPEDVALVWGQ